MIFFRMKTPPVIRDKETLKMKLQLLEVNNSTVDFKWEMFLDLNMFQKWVCLFLWNFLS